MNAQELAARLDYGPPRAAKDWFWRYHGDDMGGEITTYKRIGLRTMPELDYFMTPEDMEAMDKKSRRRWMAECHCTACGNYWYTAWLGGGEISIIAGDNGDNYPDYNPDAPEAYDRVALQEGDELLCPICCSETRLIRSTSFGGMVRRRWFTTVESIDRYTVVYYWMVHRRIDRNGCDWAKTEPWAAYSVMEDGSLIRFLYRDGRWKPSTGGDPAWIKYVSGDSCVTYHYMLGGWDCPIVPSQEGKTGERTGVATYMRAGGTYPIAYLKTWRQHYQLCKIAESPFVNILEELVRQEYNEREVACLRLEGLDLTKKKLHQILSMDKASCRSLIQTRAGHWDGAEHRSWLRYKQAGGTCTAFEFDGFYCQHGASSIESILERRKRWPWLDLPKVEKYLDTQKILNPDIGNINATTLVDTWTIMEMIYGRELRTDEEIWPGDLTAKHDSIEAAYKIEIGSNSAEASKRITEFLALREELKELEWTDGTWRVVIPRGNMDLIREGAVLRHCVDSYADNHLSGRQRIFFIRKYRRPERSYYTLSVKMDEDEPVQIQLHGYGNEAHGPNKQYKHKKDKRIQLFVDRWMREVLMPWWQEQKRKEKTA